MRAKQVAIGVLIVVATAAVWWYYPREQQSTPDELAERALHGPTETDRATAAVELADYGEGAQAALRRVLQETTETDVMAAAVEGLGKLWDYESMERLLEIVESGPEKARGRAAIVIGRMTGRDRRYRSDASETEHRRWLRFAREDWEEIRNSPYFEDLKQRLRASHESS